jgi:uncharacterized protein (DUF302 family)
MSFNKNGVIRVMSEYSFVDTFERLESKVLSQGLNVFARIDFQSDAEKAGLEMKPTRLLIFGNPKAGTPLMVASPTLAIDFPLKILVFEDSDNKVWISYNSPQYLKDRHNIPEALMKNIMGIVAIAESVAR